MFLTGLTLEVQDMVFSGKDESPLTLEIRSSSLGTQAVEEMEKLYKRLTSNGGAEILSIAWIEGKLCLGLLLPNDVQELQDLKRAQLAESLGSVVAHVSVPEVSSPKIEQYISLREAGRAVWEREQKRTSHND